VVGPSLLASTSSIGRQGLRSRLSTPLPLQEIDTYNPIELLVTIDDTPRTIKRIKHRLFPSRQKGSQDKYYITRKKKRQQEAKTKKAEQSTYAQKLATIKRQRRLDGTLISPKRVGRVDSDQTKKNRNNNREKKRSKIMIAILKEKLTAGVQLAKEMTNFRSPKSRIATLTNTPIETMIEWLQTEGM